MNGVTTPGHKLITCILPLGAAPPVARALESEKGIVTANVNNARGVGKLTRSANRRLGDQTEKQVLTIVVPEDRADEIFEFVYHQAQIGRPHGGLMYMCVLGPATPFVLPDLPEEE